jgi:hypothetical protein
VSERVVRIGGALLVGAIAAALVLWMGRRDGGEEEALRIHGVATSAFLEPVAHRFADPVTANVEAIVPTEQVDPAALEVAPQFAPYRIVSRSRSESSSRGMTTVRWRFRLMCLREACRPQPGEARVFDFPPVRISFRRRDGVPRVRRQEWHALRSVSRLDEVEAARERLSARPHPLPPVTYRVSPDRLSNGLLLAAALLALLGAALIWRTFSGFVVDSLFARKLARLGDVRRHLAVLRAAVARSDDEGQRKALDALSTSLGENGNGTDELAVGARRLAWSPRRGSSDDVLAFADDVEEAVRPRRSQ